MGRLTTHILDTMHGRPAAGVGVRLVRDGAIMVETVTNADGRTVAPLLADQDFRSGQYRLEFAIGDYFRQCGIALPKPAFLDIVALEFGLVETESHYHVPLLVSPYGYSTYRGS